MPLFCALIDGCRTHRRRFSTWAPMFAVDVRVGRVVCAGVGRDRLRVEGLGGRDLGALAARSGGAAGFRWPCRRGLTQSESDGDGVRSDGMVSELACRLGKVRPGQVAVTSRIATRRRGVTDDRRYCIGENRDTNAPCENSLTDVSRFSPTSIRGARGDPRLRVRRPCDRLLAASIAVLCSRDANRRPTCRRNRLAAFATSWSASWPCRSSPSRCSAWLQYHYGR